MGNFIAVLRKEGLSKEEVFTGQQNDICLPTSELHSGMIYQIKVYGEDSTFITRTTHEIAVLDSLLTNLTIKYSKVLNELHLLAIIHTDLQKLIESFVRVYCLRTLQSHHRRT